MKPLDPKDAPIGYVAEKLKPGEVCGGCAFKYEALCPNVRGIRSCVSVKRKDGHAVVFVKKTT